MCNRRKILALCWFVLFFAGIAFAGDCSEPSDCEATTGYLTTISVLGGLTALGAGLFLQPQPGTPAWDILHPPAPPPSAQDAGGAQPAPSSPLIDRAWPGAPPPLPATNSEIQRPVGNLTLDAQYPPPPFDGVPQRPVGNVTLDTPPSELSNALNQISDSEGIMDEIQKLLQVLPKDEVSPFTIVGTGADIWNEAVTHNPTNTEAILESLAAIETKLAVSGLPIVGEAAAILDPVLHAYELPGIGDIAGQVGRAFVSDASSELPNTWQALQQILSIRPGSSR
jgi:hypothetical protein